MVQREEGRGREGEAEYNLEDQVPKLKPGYIQMWPKEGDQSGK